jgi:RecA-family ATPase
MTNHTQLPLQDHSEGKEIIIPKDTSFNDLSIYETEQSEQEKESNEIMELLEIIKLNPDEDLPPPPTAILMNQNGDEIPICTLGNFSMIKGKAKSRKSFFLSILFASFFNDIFETFSGKVDDQNKKAMYFDTEQHRYDVLRIFKRILRLSGSDFKQLIDVYPLRKFNAAERLKMIETAIYQKPNLKLVIIDGIRDLVTSINDEDQASMITSKLLKWSEELNIHIIIVLHENKGDNNARGHLGTECMNKAEIVFSLARDTENKEISAIIFENCRRIKDPEPIAFTVNDQTALPEIVNEWQAYKKPASNRHENKSETEKYKLLIEVYSNGEQFGYSELVRQLKIAYKKLNDKNLGDNKTKEFISYCKNQKWLIQETDKAPYKIGEFSSQSDDDV